MMHSSKQVSFDKRLVLCGSMSFYSNMLELTHSLRSSGIESIMPDPDNNLAHTLNDADFQELKRRASMRHIRRIRDTKTFGILVVNFDKYGINDYVGANSFAEIAVAVAHYKRVYLYQGIPELYRDELIAWRVEHLNGSLEPIIGYCQEAALLEASQLKLFSS